MCRSKSVVISLILLSACSVAQSPFDRIFGKSSTGSAATLSTDKISAGLKEALKVGTTKAVAETGRPDGFLKNQAIKILLPPKIRSAGTGLRLIGMGPQLDELEVGMNRAAEQAAPQAKQIFLNALMQMSIDDARRILTGPDNAATTYFRDKTSANLTTAFRPIVHTALQNVGVVRQFDALTQNSMAAPLVQRFDLDGYVVGKTLDGLFYVLAQQEKQIRTNPAARTTTLLQQVFGSRMSTPPR